MSPVRRTCREWSRVPLRKAIPSLQLVSSAVREIPSAALAPRLHARFLLLEALSTIKLRATVSTISDTIVEQFFLWPGQDVPWIPLCSHLPLNESLRVGVSLSAEQDEAAAALRVIRGKQSVSRYRERERAKDEEEYKRRAAASKSAWVEKNRERHAAIQAGTRERARASRKHLCVECDEAFQSKGVLEAHCLTAKHLKCVEDGASAPERTRPVPRQTQSGRIAKESGRHKCIPCGNKPFTNNAKLKNRENGIRHKNKVKALAERANLQADRLVVAILEEVMFPVYTFRLNRICCQRCAEGSLCIMSTMLSSLSGTSVRLYHPMSALYWPFGYSLVLQGAVQLLLGMVPLPTLWPKSGEAWLRPYSVGPFSIDCHHTI